MVITNEIADLFKKCRNLLGAPVMEVELTDDMLCTALETAIEDYAERVQNWIIEYNWANLYGKNLSNTDLAFALSVRTLDMSKDFSYWFSKEVGLQQRGPWELKKDFFTIEDGQQNYLIPAGREINRVMYCNPPTTPGAIYANYGGLDMLGFSGSYGMAGTGGTYGSIGGFYIAQSCDIAYMATDLQYKTRLLRGDLTYKVTAGPEGTHIVHLYSTPGSRFTFRGALGTSGTFSLVGTEVWYTYYDTTADNVDECRRTNPDVILSPDQIPLDTIDYSLLNGPTKTIIRKLFVARAKKMLAIVWGKFSGVVSIPNASVTLNYALMQSDADKEYDEAMKELTERLERMSPYNVMQKQAEMTDNLIKIIGATPMYTFTV